MTRFALTTAVLMVFLGAGACGSPPGSDAEVCTDALDNDGDGLLDCADSDCAADPACAGGGETACADSIDNDADGQTDCDDTDCAADPACAGGGETACADSIDNDADGQTDCDDADCAADPACTSTAETICDDGLDDDGDGQTDCDDADCAADPACDVAGETCSDVLACTQACGTDTGCMQACRDAGCPSAQVLAQDLQSCVLASCLGDCAADPAGAACQACIASSCAAELAACEADDCSTAGIEVDCENAADDDGDGDVDCDDADCAVNPACQAEGLTCSEVLTCVQGCADFTCIQACQMMGCPSAQTLAGDVQTCVLNNCLGDCIGDLGGPACLACMEASCAPELAACAADTCTITSTEVDCGNGADDDGDGDTDCADADCDTDPACSAAELSCGEVLTCVEGCGADFACMQDCRDAGCASAQTLADDLQSCAMGSCLGDCAGGFGDPACQACIATSCGAELAACMADECAPVAGEVCDNAADDDGDGDTDCADADCAGDPACATGTADCGEVLTCAQTCSPYPTCISDCRATGCGSAQTAFDEVQNCVVSNCIGPCSADPAGAACSTCIGTNCSTEVGACMANTCP